MRFAARTGVTMIELVVALLIIGVGTSVATLAWRSRDSSDLDPSGAVARLASNARRIAIASGRVQRVEFRVAADGTVFDANAARAGSVVRRILALPDGTLIADSSLRLDLVGGRVPVAPERAR